MSLENREIKLHTMKKHMIFTTIILIFILGCASRNNKSKIATDNGSVHIIDSITEKYDALNDYFDTQVQDPSKEVIIFNEKTSTAMTLRLLQINDIWAVDSTGMGRKDEIFFKEEDWEKLRKQNGNYSLEKIKNAHLQSGECCWTSSNFRHKKIIFEDLKIGSSDFEKKYFSKPSYDVYWFSEPVYYKNKEYIIFSTTKSYMGGFGSTTRVIIMKKNKKKWVEVYEGKPDWHS